MQVAEDLTGSDGIRNGMALSLHCLPGQKSMQYQEGMMRGRTDIRWRKSMMAALVITLTGSGMIGAGYGAPVTSDAPSIRSAMPSDSDGIMVYRAALRAKGTKIMVSTEKRWLWLISGRDTIVSAPIAIGSGKNFSFNGKSYKFSTPRGKRVVRSKTDEPIWTVPEWHYLEKAAEKGLEVVYLKPGQTYELEDGTWIDIRENQVGRVNRFGNWHPFSQDFEIMFENKIFVPPMGTVQRTVTDALGPYKLDMGEGYLIHGTHIYNENSIGLPASHGCVRMRNADLGILYQFVDPGTPVFIF
jgi:hypothetical protein